MNVNTSHKWTAFHHCELLGAFLNVLFYQMNVNTCHKCMAFLQCGFLGVYLSWKFGWMFENSNYSQNVLPLRVQFFCVLPNFRFCLLYTSDAADE